MPPFPQKRKAHAHTRPQKPAPQTAVRQGLFHEPIMHGDSFCRMQTTPTCAVSHPLMPQTQTLTFGLRQSITFFDKRL